VHSKSSRKTTRGGTLYTIGHSDRSFEAFLALLRAHGIAQVVDVRTIPKSRHNPQFVREALAPALRARKINYRWLPALGGLRHARKDSPNTGWHNASFRGFADYMATDEFADGLATLEGIARKKCATVMCAEAVPWRCHRSLIADALLQRGWSVCHIMSRAAAKPHALTSFLRVREGEIVYPPA
jgi:uncharacterized protein (DUF488 family)